MIRTVIVPNTQTVSFDIPMDYIGKELEVIAFTISEGLETVVLPTKEVSFSAISVDTQNLKFNRDETNER